MGLSMCLSWVVARLFIIAWFNSFIAFEQNKTPRRLDSLENRVIFSLNLENLWHIFELCIMVQLFPPFISEHLYTLITDSKIHTIKSE